MSYSPYLALHESVRRWIDERQWQDFTKIQADAIPAILGGKGALLVAPTAGGKTEAALLPIVSAILTDKSPPISLLYIAPLRALINDQANRAELLLRDTPLKSAWWHGDLSQSRRQAIARNLPDALLTTPESLEVHLSSQTYRQGALLGNVRFVLIDEIHAFAESDRGAQLVSLLTRLEALMHRPLTRVALSATIGNPPVIAGWLGSKRTDANPIDVICDPGVKKRALMVGLVHVPRQAGESESDHRKRVNDRSYDVVAMHVINRRSIVFVRSRAEAEILTSKLRSKGIETVIHHGSLSVEMRRMAEEAMKREGPKTIVATSTLELGIDIGDLEQVLQLGTIGSVSSWLQRIGRSGRSKDGVSIGIMYARKLEELPEAIALCDLADESISEALVPDRCSFSVAFHQTLNLLRERDRVARSEIRGTLGPAGCFDGITADEWDTLLDEMIEDGFLEIAGDAIQLGPQTELQFGFSNYKDFYAVFRADSGWTVKHQTTRVGDLPADYPFPENREVRFVLAGRWWRAVHVDAKAMVVTVEPIESGAPPKWRGGEADTSFEVMQRTAAVLAGAPSRFITAGLRQHLDQLMTDAESSNIGPQRIVVGERPSGVDVVTYAGQRVNRYLGALIGTESKGVVSLLIRDEDILLPAAAGFVVEDVATMLERILTDEPYRLSLEETALRGMRIPVFGKFGDKLGPRSKVNALRGQFRQVPHLTELKSFVVCRRGVLATRVSQG